jgi:DNA-binding transcriptional LysR family regulator
MNNNLNLLVVFDAIMRGSSLTTAAKDLHVTQPALSRSLARLREDFGDPLFVRGKGRLIPTPKALELWEPVAKLLKQAGEIYKQPRPFDPSTAHGVVRIATTDYFEQVLWASILKSLHKMAPNLTFVTQMTGSHLPVEEMLNGHIQLAIAGYFKEIPSGFLQQSVFSDRFLSMVRKGHPLVTDRMSIQSYLKMGHVIISPSGDLSTTVDSILAKSNKRRRIVASVAGFQASGPIVATTDLILTAPGRLVKNFAKRLPVEIHAPPLDLPAINVIQVWHERFNNDEMVSWVRRVIATECHVLQDQKA